MTPTLETRRLILVPISLNDAPAVQVLFPRWEIVRFLNERVPWPYPADGALQFIGEVLLPAVERGEQWAWGIRLKGGPDHLIGAINLGINREDNRGFWLGLPWHGRGYMTEACEPVTDFWFNVLGQERLVVVKAVHNRASSRISQKQGSRMMAIKDRNFVAGRWPAEFWEMTRAEWNVRPGKGPRPEIEGHALHAVTEPAAA